jgi:hypothetical protein
MVTTVTAMLGLAVIGCGSGSTTATGPPPSVPESPLAVASEPVLGGSIRQDLRYRWMGGHRDVPGVLPLAGTSIILSADDFALTQSGGSGDRHLLSSSASAVSVGQVRLELTANAAGCTAGNVGLYSWSLSPSGRTLTIGGKEDECSPRLAALRGAWWRMACKDPHDDVCLGDLDAGTYGSQYIVPRLDPGVDWEPVFGALTYTVPDGWANSADWPDRLNLVPSTDFAKVTPDQQEVDSEVLVFTQPIALKQGAPCFTGEPQSGVGRTVDDLITWLDQVPGLTVTESKAVSLDGNPGQWVDLRVDPDRTSACEELEFMKPSGGDPVVIGGEERERLILLDLGQGDVVGIRIFSRNPASFDALVAEAMPIVESFQFK